jgi:hypothetical protein
MQDEFAGKSQTCKCKHKVTCIYNTNFVEKSAFKGPISTAPLNLSHVNVILFVLCCMTILDNRISPDNCISLTCCTKEE